ncbi:MAG TPA: flagellar basal body-associated FliL family protein [Pirellulales bacterium]|jgi:flagellar FliL protein|nr:flagellar basal body-associated FliL family protein [Pirellulales bacterium]
MAESATSNAAGAEAGGKKLSKGKIIGFVGGIVLLQCVLAWLYLPGSAAKAEAKKEAAAHADDKDKDKDSDPTATDGHGENREVDLGKFSLTAFDPNSNTTLLIDFHLYGTVAVDASDKAPKDAGEKEHAKGGKPGEVGDDDNSTFGKLFKKDQHRFRDQVIVIIRNATMADLADPSLGLIKRQILAKTNSLLGEPLVKEIVFSDFAVVQQ